MMALPARADSFTINDIRFGDHPDKIRMVLELSDVKPFRAFAMDNPWRMVIDFPHFDWNVPSIGRPKGATVTSIRQGTLQPGISRIVIDFQHPVAVSNAFILPRDPAANKPDRLVVDFSRTDERGFVSTRNKVFGKLQVAGEGNPAIATLETAPVIRESAVQTFPLESTENNVTKNTYAAPIPGRKPNNDAPVSASVPAKKPVIVIDAGHGGVDTGALGANGVYEKQVTLNMAKALKE